LYDTVQCYDPQDWTSTLLLHVYQGQLISDPTMDSGNEGAFIDLRNLDSFEEKFYLVVIEKGADNQSYLHMWEIIISSIHNSDNGMGSFITAAFQVWLSEFVPTEELSTPYSVT